MLDLGKSVNTIDFPTFLMIAEKSDVLDHSGEVTQAENGMRI
jgi:hypothetical protein